MGPKGPPKIGKENVLQIFLMNLIPPPSVHHKPEKIDEDIKQNLF